MDDLISRQEVLALPRNVTRTLSGKVVEETIDVELINALPPVQPEIIHCKDCAFYEKEIGGNDGFALGMCRFIEQHYVANEGFCFWAKKKGEQSDIL